MSNRWYNIRARSDSEAEILIYDEIGFELTAKDFARDLKALGNVATLNVRINSPGGVLFDGIAMHSILKRHPARKIIHVDGAALSVASLVLCAGDERRISRGAWVMVHNPETGGRGNAGFFRETAEILDRAQHNMLGIYADRTGQKPDKIKALMDAETWMEPEQALALGFVDSITEETRRIAAHVDLSKFRAVPEMFRKALADPPDMRRYLDRIDSNAAKLGRVR